MAIALIVFLYIIIAIIASRAWKTAWLRSNSRDAKPNASIHWLIGALWIFMLVLIPLIVLFSFLFEVVFAAAYELLCEKVDRVVVSLMNKKNTDDQPVDS